MKILEVVDCSGYSCPGPLIQTKTYYETAKEGTSFKIIVDNEVSSLNVERFLKQNGCDYEIIKESDTRYLLYSDVKNSKTVDNSKNNTLLYYIASASVGAGDCDLGRAMLEGLIANIKNLDKLPNTLIFINTGVKALAESDSMQKNVAELIDIGVETYYCGTCSEHFKVTKDIKVGIVSNLHEIMTLLGNHDRVIKP
jgi:selenium metabolism protein YedF